MKKRARDKNTASPAPRESDTRFAGGDALNRSDARNVALVCAVALALRLAFFLLNRTNNPVFHHPIMDGLYHDQWARRILAGDFWGDEVFFRAPLYPYFLALVYKIGGSSVAVAALVQHVLGTATAGLTYLLARRVFAPAVALVAGLLAATYWPFVYFEGDLLIVTLIVFLDVLALWLLTGAMQSGRAAQFLYAGLVLGLSAIARPSVLIFLPFVPVALWLNGRRTARRWIAQGAWLYAGALVVIAPVIVRNYTVGRDVVPIASQGGVNFYIGNNPLSDGVTAIVPGTRASWQGGYEDAIRLAEKEAGRKLRPSEVSNHYFRKGLSFVFGSPGESLPHLARKLRLFWAGGERSNNKSIYFFWHQSGMGRVPLPGFWLVAPLGLLGCLLLWRARPETTLLLLFIASYSAGVVAFFVNSRFRQPVVPVLAVFAAYAVFHVIDAARTRGRGALRTAGLAAVCVAVVNHDFVTFPENKLHLLSAPHYTLGNAYLEEGNADAALREYETALRKHREHPSASFQIIARSIYNNLGRMYYAGKNYEKAIPMLERVGGDDHFAVAARVRLADCYLRTGRVEDAVTAYERIVTASPREVEAQLGLGKAYRAAGRLEESERTLATLVRSGAMPGGRPVFELGRTLEAQQRWNDAAQAYAAAARDPSVRVYAYRGSGRVCEATGRREHAIEFFRLALREDPDHQPTLQALRKLGAIR